MGLGSEGWVGGLGSGGLGQGVGDLGSGGWVVCLTCCVANLPCGKSSGNC